LDGLVQENAILNAARAELVSTKVRMDGLVQENAALNAALTAAKSELDEWPVRERGYREAQQALEIRIAGFRGDIRTASTRIAELEKTTDRLNEQVGAAERELAGAWHELSSSRAKAQTAEATVSRLETEITTLNSQSEVTQQALSEAQRELTAAQRDASEREARAAQLEAEIDELKGRIESLDSAMAEAQSELLAAQERAAEAAANASRLQGELSAAEERAAEAAANAARLQGEIERAQAAVVEAARKAEHFERGAAEREVLQVELAERQERIDRVSKAQADAERALQIALGDREREVRELVLERARLSAEKEELALRLRQVEAGPKPPPPEADFGRLQLQVASQVSLLSSELDRLRRAMQPKDNDGSNHGPRIEVLREAYIDLLENTLTDRMHVPPKTVVSNGNGHYGGLGTADWKQLVQGKSPIALARMRNIRRLLESVLADSVSGDLLEAGSGAGGGSLYMRGLLAAYGVTDRRVWVADVFPDPAAPSDETRLAADEGDVNHTLNEVTATIEAVKADFCRYNLLDSQVVFLAGCLNETLPKTSKRLALLRLDGDVYQSILDTLDATYRKLSPGGYVIVDDYMLPGPLKAVHDFRDRYGIVEELQTDGATAFWRKGS
jgi:predicted  nucleic acid-binding Zn-ribbon protein